MADMKKEFEKLGGQAISVFAQFFSFFTVKRVLTLAIVVLALFLVCSPQDTPTQSEGEAVECGSACPMPEVITVPTIVVTEVAKDNWKFDLLGEGWEDRDQMSENTVAAKVNTDMGCKLFLLREDTDDSLTKHAIETLRGFTEHAVLVDSVRIIDINGNRFVNSLLVDDDDAIWIWMAVKNHHAYTFACGCYDNRIASNVCPGTAESLQIK